MIWPAEMMRSENLGRSPETVDKFVAMIRNYLGKPGGSDMKNLLSKAPEYASKSRDRGPLLVSLVARDVKDKKT